MTSVLSFKESPSQYNSPMLLQVGSESVALYYTSCKYITICEKEKKFFIVNVPHRMSLIQLKDNVYYQQVKDNHSIVEE